MGDTSKIRTARALTGALACALIFGVFVLAGGDWLPGVLIVVAAVVGLAIEVRNLRQLHTPEQPPV